MNNGIMLRAVNIQRFKYNKLETIFNTVSDLITSTVDKISAITYLVDNEYLHIRDNTIISKENYCDLEVKVTAKGIRILAGAIEDMQVIV